MEEQTEPIFNAPPTWGSQKRSAAGHHDRHCVHDGDVLAMRSIICSAGPSLLGVGV